MAMSRALERFDDELHDAKPPGWKVREKAWREPMSEVGQLSFRRRVYIDDVGDRRCMLDEVLDLPKGAHITPGAFDKLTCFGVQTSYHATAKLFNRHIEGGITAQSAMNALRTSAALLKSETEKKAKNLFDEGVIPDAETFEREVLLEADGVWVPLQMRGRSSSEKKMPASFEVKAMVAYSGKAGARGKRRRLDKVVFNAVTRPDSFWRQGVATMAEKFEIDKVERVILGADGGGWCGKAGDYMPLAKVDFRLDQYHVNRNVVAALRGKKDQTEALRILYKEGVDALVEYLEAVPPSHANASMSQAIEYLRRHGGDIDPRGPSMGTMESTNAHVIGSRMKAVGGAWSRDGGNAMARARAHVANGGRLPRPHSQVEVDHKTRWWYFWEAWRMDNAGPGAADFPEIVGSGEQERVLSWHAGSRQARERFEAAIAYETPRFVPAPFDPMVKLRCHANRTHAKPDDLGRNRLQPR